MLKEKPAIHFAVMWLRGTVHINKWGSLLCICLRTRNDGFKRKRSHVFSKTAPSDTIRPRKTMHHNAYLHLTLSNGLGYCLRGLITESACGVAAPRQASRQSWQIARQVVSEEDDGGGRLEISWRPVQSPQELFITQAGMYTPIHQMLE